MITFDNPTVLQSTGSTAFTVYVALEHDDTSNCAGASCTGSVWRYSHAGQPRDVPFVHNHEALPNLKIARNSGQKGGLLTYYGDGVIHLSDVGDGGTRTR